MKKRIKGAGGYGAFLKCKERNDVTYGFEPRLPADSFLFDFQRELTEWSVRKGRSAIFADCGLGKTPMQLAWAEEVVRKSNGKVLILTPLAVARQTVREGGKFGIEVVLSRDGGLRAGKRIFVTNYEKMHLFDFSAFSGCVCDESGILKNYAGATRSAIIAALRGVPYRLLCSATPSPNDYGELGNSAEALGTMRRAVMLSTFFTHDSGDTAAAWRLRGHATEDFWRFLASWSRAVRLPSDLGFDDGPFVLPEMVLKQHTLPSRPPPGRFFASEARTLADQRNERRETIGTRCRTVAELAATDRPFLAWCSLNAESEELARIIPDAVEVTGSQSDEEKEERLTAFTEGQARVLVSKPSICGFGLNWQHCADMAFFPSHSHEQFYQATRRCWRFGQRRTVTVHVVTTEAERRVVENMRRKELDAERMYTGIVRHMREYYKERPATYQPEKGMWVPSWIR